jgi:hypothetical protein
MRTKHTGVGKLFGKSQYNQKLQSFFGGWLTTEIEYLKRGLGCDTICPSCSRLDEDGEHLFLK